MPILWNTSKNVIESKFDGQPYVFQPDGQEGSKKRIGESVCANHLLFKLEDYGLVMLPDDGLTDKMIQEARIKGITARRRMLESRLRAFRSMNKEREAAKLSAEQPTDLIIETCKELDELDALLKELKKDDYAIVNRRLGTLSEDQAEKSIKDREQKIEVTSTRAKLVGGRKKAESVS